MECLEIDWKNIDDTFVRDDFYESFEAPKWIDFSVPEQPVNAHQWFCGKVGCIHEEQTDCQAPPCILITASEPQETSKSLPAPQVPIVVATALAPLAEKLVSASTGKRARGVVSTSLSSLPDNKAENFVKSKGLHNTHMPPIAERKGQLLRKTLHHACENEQPSQLCKAQEGLKNATINRIYEGVVKKIKRSEQKDAGKAVKVNVVGREVQARIFKDISTVRGVSKVSRSVTSLERRILSQGRRTVCKNVVKEQFADVSNLCSEVKTLEGTKAPLSGPSKLLVRNSHFMSSSSTMSSKKAAVVSQSLTSASLKTENSIPSRPPYIVARKDAKIGGAYSVAPATKLVVLPGELKKDDQIPAETTLPLSDEHSMEVGQEKRLPGIEICAVGVDQDPHQRTLMKESRPCNQFLAEAMLLEQDPQVLSKDEDTSFDKAKELEKKQCLSTENEVLTQPWSQERTERSEELNPLEKRQKQLLTEKHIHAVGGEQNNQEENEVQFFIGKPNPPEVGEISKEKDARNQFGMDNDLVQHTLEDFLRNLHLATPEDESGILASENLGDCTAEQEMVVSMRSSYGTTSSQLSKPINSDAESCAMSAISHGSSSLAVSSETTGQKPALDANKDYGKEVTNTTQRKQNLVLPSRPSSQGKKRKSSDLNPNTDCSYQFHPIEKAISTIPPANSPSSLQFESSSASCPAAALSQICSDSCKGQHKKMRTTAVQPFKPFRLRTEERGALKELGLGKKEPEPPTAQEIVHHALRMPSFGHPFVPQRSTKKIDHS